MKQRLYHGGLEYVLEPNLHSSGLSCDFGPGFYTTPYSAQAKEWAEHKMRVTDHQHYAVSEYELEYEAADNLNIKRFTEPDAEWMKLVLDGRSGLSNPYDIIIGPLADSGLNRILFEYQQELLKIPFKNGRQFTEDRNRLMAETAKKLANGPKRNYTQCVFITDRALSKLRFIDGIMYNREGQKFHTFKYGLIDRKSKKGKQTEKMKKAATRNIQKGGKEI